MLRLARRVAVLVLTLLFIPFALSNRQSVALAFWPFEGVIEVPLYLLLVAVSSASRLVRVVTPSTAGGSS